MSADRQPGGGKSPAKRGKPEKSGRTEILARTGGAKREEGNGKAMKAPETPSHSASGCLDRCGAISGDNDLLQQEFRAASPEVRVPDAATRPTADNVPAQSIHTSARKRAQPSLPGLTQKSPTQAGFAPSSHTEASVADSEQTQLPAGPVLPPKAVFSSRDIPPDSPSHRQAPLSVALNNPSPPTAAPTAPVPPVKPSLARIAIVIDDFGQNIEIAKKFLLLPFPVAFSILPYQQHSREIAELAHSHGKEVLLHCPMEPIGYPKVDPGRGALLLSMSDDTIRRNIRTILDNSPYITGVNNHMGSRMTENATAMKTVLGGDRPPRTFFHRQLHDSPQHSLPGCPGTQNPEPEAGYFSRS